MKRIKGAFVFIGLTSAIAVACGGAEPEAKSPDSAAGSASTIARSPGDGDPPPNPTTASSNPPAASSPPMTTSPPSESADAGKSASATGAPTSEPKDECTPVGIDFEKRARPKLKDCYAEGKKKDANLQGTVKIKLTIDLKGKIKNTKVVEKTLPDAVAQCMLKAVQATPFPEVDKCWDSTITIPITFPTPK